MRLKAAECRILKSNLDECCAALQREKKASCSQGAIGYIKIPVETAVTINACNLCACDS